MKNIVESWKTTSLGILVLIAAITYIFVVQDSKVFQFCYTINCRYWFLICTRHYHRRFKVCNKNQIKIKNF